MPAGSATACAACAPHSAYCPRCVPPPVPPTPPPLLPHQAAPLLRIELSFNYGWQFLYLENDAGLGGGESGGGSSRPTCRFNTSLSGQVCSGLELDTHRFAEHDCRMACCTHERCVWWQHRTVPPTCWLGYDDQPTAVTCRAGTADDTPRTGAHRTRGGAPPVSRLFSSEVLDANAQAMAWERIDLPHDFVHVRPRQFHAFHRPGHGPCPSDPTHCSCSPSHLRRAHIRSVTALWGQVRSRHVATDHGV